MSDRRSLIAVQDSLLAIFADPLSNPPESKLVAMMEPQTFLELLDSHGLLSLAVRLLAPVAEELPTQWQVHLRAAEEQSVIGSAVTLMLEDHGRRIATLFDGADAGVNFQLLKGSTFAAYYPYRSDRPYTDIDFLVERAALGQCQDILLAAGYHRLHRPADNSDRYQEYQFGRSSQPGLLIEIHGDIVHRPALRRKVGLDLRALSLATDGGRHKVAGDFLVACLHGTAGHKLHALRFLTDVLQTARAMDEPARRHLAGQLPHLKATPEVMIALDAAELVFAEPIIAETRAALRLKRGPAILRRIDLLRTIGAGAIQSKLRRHAMRQWQLKLAPRG